MIALYMWSTENLIKKNLEEVTSNLYSAYQGGVGGVFCSKMAKIGLKLPHFRALQEETAIIHVYYSVRTDLQLV